MPKTQRQRWWRLVMVPVITGLFGMMLTVAASAQDMGSVMSSDTAIGPVLTDANGMTLYSWDRDDPTAKTISTSASATWPRLMVSGAPVGVDGIGASARDDGGLQATFNGWPLYYFINDKNAGDTLGDGVGGIWHVVSLASAAPAPVAAPAAAATTVGVGPTTSRGVVLADGTGMT